MYRTRLARGRRWPSNKSSLMLDAMYAGLIVLVGLESLLLRRLLRQMADVLAADAIARRHNIARQLASAKRHQET